MSTEVRRTHSAWDTDSRFASFEGGFARRGRENKVISSQENRMFSGLEV